MGAQAASAHMGKHSAKELFGCFVSACCSAAFFCVLGKHCMQTVHFKSITAWRLASPLLPPPPAASLAALAMFFARDMAVLFALPPPIAGSLALPPNCTKDCCVNREPMPTGD